MDSADTVTETVAESGAAPLKTSWLEPDSGCYIHVPFCRERCRFCHFSSRTSLGGIPPWLGSVLTGIADVVSGLPEVPGDPGEIQVSGDSVTTLYLGGGTPSLLPHVDLRSVLDAGHRAFPGLREVTVECHPADLNPELVALLVDCGATRLSVGVQSFNGGLRRSLGRCAPNLSPAEALQVARAFSGALSIDLITGMPGQTDHDAAADVRQAVEAGAEHLSVYDLSPPPQQERTSDGPERRAALLAAAAAEAESLGLQRYEVSSFSVPGSECLHNRNYWRLGTWLAFGEGAEGRLRQGAGAIGYRVSSDGRARIETQSPADCLRDYVIASLRTRDGVDPARATWIAQVDVTTLLTTWWQEDVPAELKRDGTDGHLCLSQEGWLLENRLCSAFLDRAAGRW